MISREQAEAWIADYFPNGVRGGLRIAKCEIGDGPSECVSTLNLGIQYGKHVFYDRYLPLAGTLGVGFS